MPTNFKDELKEVDTWVQVSGGSSVINYQIGAPQDHKRVFFGLAVDQFVLDKISNITDARIGWSASIDYTNQSPYDTLPLGLNPRSCTVTIEFIKDNKLQRESLFIPYVKGTVSELNLKNLVEDISSVNSLQSVRITSIKYNSMKK